MSSKKKWADLSSGTRTAVTISAAVQITLLALSHRDISRRDASEIRGSKGAWRAATLVNFIGPLAYFAFGRRRDR